jgi:hypothetical protein
MRGIIDYWWTTSLQKVILIWEIYVKVFHSALYVIWKILIDYEAIDKGCPLNPVEK